MVKMKNWTEKIYAYALKNAIEHNGKSIENAVISSLFHEGLEKEEVKNIISEVKKIVSEINSLSLKEQEEKFRGLEKKVDRRKERHGLPSLPNAKKGKVTTRMSPSPSGGLTLGNILTIVPNFLYVLKYGGKFYIRIEDTNPEKVYKPSYNMIKKESKWICKNKVNFIIQSERMKLYYKYAEMLIKKNAAYVCTCEQEKFKELILKSKPCSCRNLTVKENLERWKKMLDKSKNSYREGDAVLRFKSNLQNKNPAMRDFPLARINEKEHPLQKKKYKVWPLMNLAVTVDDIELKMTHIIRGKDHKDNAERQKMMYKILGKKYPWTAFIGKIHFTDLEMSKSKIRKDIEEGKYKGWDDERLPTAASLIKQGYKPEAFWRFAEQRGISEADKIINKEEFFQILRQFNK